MPDFDLRVEGEDLSLMDGMLEQGYTVYAVDLRGYGGTPRDSTQWVTPLVAANDILNILSWISEQNRYNKVHLFGWSMGSTLALLATQIDADNIASLTLFGFWKDLDVPIPEDPADFQLRKQVNTDEDAAGDFITPGSISDNAINTYVIEPYSTISHLKLKQPKVESWHKCGTSNFKVSLHPKPAEL